jgi:Tol biopolymer transport system component
MTKIEQLVAFGVAATSCITNPTALTPPAADAAVDPAFSGVLVGTDPFVWAVTPSTHIFTMNVDGSDKRVLTDDASNRTPQWTCDGKRIVYTSGQQIWLMDADGGNKRQITSLPRGADAPSISCNGKLLFGSFSPKTQKATLWIMDSLTSAPRQLSSDDNFDAAGRISPDGRWSSSSATSGSTRPPERTRGASSS